MNQNEKHRKLPANYIGGTIKDLANEIGDLHYEALHELFEELAIKLKLDGEADLKRGRIQLSRALKSAGHFLDATNTSINTAWRISKPYMTNGNK